MASCGVLEQLAGLGEGDVAESALERVRRIVQVISTTCNPDGLFVQLLQDDNQFSVVLQFKRLNQIIGGQLRPLYILQNLFLQFPFFAVLLERKYVVFPLLESISSTFYARVFCTKVLFCPNVTREKHFGTKNVGLKC